MGYYCDNEDEHRSDARRDFNYRGSYGYDREYYEHHSFDACKVAYTEEFDKMRDEERRQEERREEERQQEQMEMRQEQARRERCQAEEDYYMQMSEQEYMEHMRQQEPPQNNPDDSLPF